MSMHACYTLESCRDFSHRKSPRPPSAPPPSLQKLMLWVLLCVRAQNIKIDWSTGGPQVDLQPHLSNELDSHEDRDAPFAEHEAATVDPTGRVTLADASEMPSAAVDEPSAVEIHDERDLSRGPSDPDTYTPSYPSTAEAPPASQAAERDGAETDNGAESTEGSAETPRGSMRATLKRLGVSLPKASEDERSLREALDRALRAARMPMLRGLLFERGGRCNGCAERSEFESAVVASLRSPLVGRHALPLFLYDQPLFPHTQMGLHLYEPRYKLLCRKALKAEHVFGFVSGDVGTLAKIKSWSFTDDDAKDGSCRMTVLGLRRFRMGRQWEEKCAGCDKPLSYADATYFQDGQQDVDMSRRSASAADVPALVKESLRLHYAVTSAEGQRELEAQLGEAPRSRDQSAAGYAMSMWLAAACVSAHAECRAQAAHLLSTTSTAGRLERVLKVQRSLVGKKYSRTPRKKK